MKAKLEGFMNPVVAITKYDEKAKDYPSRDLFEELMKDEEHHIDFLETQLDLVDKLGLELYAQNHIGKMGEGDD